MPLDDDIACVVCLQKWCERKGASSKITEDKAAAFLELYRYNKDVEEGSAEWKKRQSRKGRKDGHKVSAAVVSAFVPTTV